MANDVKWIKIVTDIFDDEKILMIETLPECDTIIVIWFKLLCLAGKQNNSGVFQMGHIPYTDEMFSTIFRRPLNTVRLALNTFEKFGMVEIVNDVITIPNWGKHQSLEQLEEKRRYQREYQREYRKKQQLLAAPGDSESKCSHKHLHKHLHEPNVNALDKNKNKIRLEEDIEVVGEANRKRFTPPTLAEVAAYVAERNSKVDPQEFIDFYESKGWMVGKNKMKDWKAACRNAEKWDRWNKPQNRVGANGIPISNRKSDLEGVF